MLDDAANKFIEAGGKLDASVMFQPGRYKEGSTTQEADQSQVAISQVSDVRWLLILSRRPQIAVFSSLDSQVCLPFLLCQASESKYEGQSVVLLPDQHVMKGRREDVKGRNVFRHVARGASLSLQKADCSAFFSLHHLNTSERTAKAAASFFVHS